MRFTASSLELEMWSASWGWDRGQGTYRHRRGRGVAAKSTTEVVRTIGSGSTAVVRGRRGRTVRSTYSRVVLRATPRQTDTGVPNRIALHLVDRHFSSMAMNKLDKATALARGDLDVCYFAKTLEERPELVFGDVSRQAADEDSRVVGVSELVHLATSHLTASHLTTRLHATVGLVGVERSGLLHVPADGLHGVAHHGTTVSGAVVWVLVTSV